MKKMNTRELMNASGLIAKHNLTNSVAAVTVSWNEDISKLTVIYHIDGIASDEDQELCDLTLTELLAEFSDVKLADSYCVSTGDHFDKLEQLKGLVYKR